jgi:hypothetical protein
MKQLDLYYSCNPSMGPEMERRWIQAGKEEMAKCKAGAGALKKISRA